MRLDSHLAALAAALARRRAGRQAHRVPAPGDPARAQHDRLQGGRRGHQRLVLRPRARWKSSASRCRTSSEARVAMLITISGLPGSGKTTVARLVARDARARARLRRATSSAARPQARGSRSRSTRAAPRPTTRSTARLDDQMRERAARGKAVLEGRLAAFMAERGGRRRRSRVFLDASEAVRAARITGREGGRAARAAARDPGARGVRRAAATARSTASTTTTRRATISSLETDGRTPGGAGARRSSSSARRREPDDHHRSHRPRPRLHPTAPTST